MSFPWPFCNYCSLQYLFLFFFVLLALKILTSRATKWCLGLVCTWVESTITCLCATVITVLLLTLFKFKFFKGQSCTVIHFYYSRAKEKLVDNVTWKQNHMFMYCTNKAPSLALTKNSSTSALHDIVHTLCIIEPLSKTHNWDKCMSMDNAGGWVQ